MKNKEIEELLNKMKNCNGIFDYYLEYGEVDLLLSYIEQLKKENKILKDNAENNDRVVDKVNWENQQLKKQKDDVVEYMKERITYDSSCNMTVETYISPQKILRMLGEIDD